MHRPRVYTVFSAETECRRTAGARPGQSEATAVRWWLGSTFRIREENAFAVSLADGHSRPTGARSQWASGQLPICPVSGPMGRTSTLPVLPRLGGPRPAIGVLATSPRAVHRAAVPPTQCRRHPVPAHAAAEEDEAEQLRARQIRVITGEAHSRWTTLAGVRLADGTVVSHRHGRCREIARADFLAPLDYWWLKPTGLGEHIRRLTGRPRVRARYCRNVTDIAAQVRRRGRCLGRSGH
jgi:hypothetical protein